ncbi:MAG TPA: cytochrome c biogenesis protein CcdA [bacterium]|nr:cytochrome c biogenesis protein CcdA [bacterium]
MIDSLFSSLGELMTGNFSLALLASLIWGVLSVLLSPCHLSSIPLVIGYISSCEKRSTRSSFSLALVFALGISITIALVGGITASLGRLIGDVGIWGNILVAAIFFIMGLYLLDIISLNWGNTAISSNKGGYPGAFSLGLLFGLGLGPCTFAYLAPVLGIVFSMAQSSWVKPSLLILAFTIGHCAVITLAGGLGQWVQNYLNWSAQSRSTQIVKRVAGLLVLLGGVYFLMTALLPVL